MSKRHKPITRAQIALLRRASAFGVCELESYKQILVMQALQRKGLGHYEYFEGEWLDGDYYAREAHVMHITPLGKRYLRFIDSLPRDHVTEIRKDKHYVETTR